MSKPQFTEEEISDALAVLYLALSRCDTERERQELLTFIRLLDDAYGPLPDATEKVDPSVTETGRRVVQRITISMNSKTV
jgi:hypothetical protein